MGEHTARGTARLTSFHQMLPFATPTHPEWIKLYENEWIKLYEKLTVGDICLVFTKPTEMTCNWMAQGHQTLYEGQHWSHCYVAWEVTSQEEGLVWGCFSLLCWMVISPCLCSAETSEMKSAETAEFRRCRSVLQPQQAPPRHGVYDKLAKVTNPPNAAMRCQGLNGLFWTFHCWALACPRAAWGSWWRRRNPVKSYHHLAACLSPSHNSGFTKSH